MTEQQEEQRRYALAISGGKCEICGKPLGPHAQGAHRIANTKANRTKWGSFIIDHPLNIAMTCSLGCNSSCNIGQDPRKCLDLVKHITDYELRKYGA